jgi:putative mRNA 3-end processing factor
MARNVNHIYAGAPEYLADAKKFRRAMESVHLVEHAGQRRHVLRDADVVVTTGGMLDGGPVLHYIAELYRDANSSIFLTGFQVDGSNGRQLLDEGTLTIDEVTVRPACDIEKFDFSAHAGHSQLVQLVERSRAKTVVLMHGDDRAKLAKSLEGTVQVLTPENGERITV